MTTDHPTGWLDRMRGARSVRVRILGAVVLLNLVGLIVAGAVAYLVAGNRIDSRVDRLLLQEIQEFEELQRKGVDPRTGEPFTSPERLFRVAMQRNVPDERETIVAFFDGALFVHPDARFPLGSYAPFRRAVDQTVEGNGWGSVDTPEGTVRFAVKPVVQGNAEGAYVAAYFTAPEFTELAEVGRAYAVVALFALIVVTIAGWLVAGRLLRPIRLVRSTAQEISDTDLTRRIDVDGRDDVSDLARTFNAMLDRLAQAFGTQRQFLDDAGHELRTPITIMRGHLELLDAGDAGDVAATRALVVDELDRMSRLVDDLILLAKARRPDFLHPEPVDLAAFTDEVLNKVTALGDRDWRLDEHAAGTVVVDAQRLTQALVQLASNAVRHTGEGDVIAIGTATGSGWARLWVRDTGVGVDEVDQERIFDRFVRGANAKPGESSGLGLSIVRAIAEAHGGRVLLHSQPGSGATFTVVVPVYPWQRGGDPPDVGQTLVLPAFPKES